MSELLQPGRHPDSDQLSAFVEHALPPHEQQQTLAHLAICADCRATVALSMPPLEESPKPQPEPAHKPWFSGWRLALPAAAAFAGLAFLIHVRNSASIKSSETTNEVAVSQPFDTSAPLPSGEPSSQLAAKTQQPNSSSAVSGGAPGRSQPQMNVAVPPQLSAKLPLNSPQAQLAPSNGLAQLHGSAGGAAGTGSAFQAPASVALDSPQQNSAATQGDLVSQPSSATAMALRQQAAAVAKPSPPPSASANVVVTNQSVEVASASPVATLSSTNNFVLKETKSIVAEHPLPSRLAAISVASNASKTIAIDSSNTLFLSDDGGQHWKTISPQWQGRAVHVALASAAVRGQSYALSEISNPRSTASLGAIGGPVPPPPAPPPAPGPGSSVSGTITDPSGAVIPNASVVVSDATTRTVRGVTADAAGRYLVDDLAPGKYQVEAEAPGFMKQQLAFTLAASQHSQANLTLQIGQASQTVTVDALTVSPATRDLAKKKAAAPRAANQPLFEITTDTGQRWTSPDGQIWKRQ
jgi:hypothetical protein